MEELLTEILGRDLAAMGPGERFEVVMNERFKARVMRAFHNRWFRVNDGVGWVNSNPAPVIARAVAKKTGLLPKYREAVGGDVRLLLVANRLFASGKLQVVDEATVDTEGFRVVYFLSYPESVTVFHEQGA